MSHAKSEAEAQSCYGKMTPEQRHTMNQAAMEMMTPPGGAGGAGAGSAPAGDLVGGSAGAGAAAK